MRTKLSKEAFIKRTGERIALREQIYGFYKNEFTALLRKWDGRVYNKRFRDAGKINESFSHGTEKVLFG